jgi:hypothetical protein
MRGQIMKRTEACIATLAGIGLLGLFLIDFAPRSAAYAQSITRDRDAGAGGNARIVPPGERPGRGRWFLGITAETLDIGVRVRDVVPRSPAERAGLERGDVIVTVEGYQVGRVSGREYPLDRELDDRADSGGRVRLLVQNRRNNQLTNMDVRLDQDRPGPGPGPGPREGVVSGEVTYRDRSALPRDAELRIKIFRRKFLGSDTIAERTFPVRGQPPLRFELRYDIDRADLDKTYEVSAEIYSAGRRLYSEDGTYRIRPADPPVPLNIQMKRD